MFQYVCMWDKLPGKNLSACLCNCEILHIKTLINYHAKLVQDYSVRRYKVATKLAPPPHFRESYDKNLTTVTSSFSL